MKSYVYWEHSGPINFIHVRIFSAHDVHACEASYENRQNSPGVRLAILLVSSVHPLRPVNTLKVKLLVDLPPPAQLLLVTDPQGSDCQNVAVLHIVRAIEAGVAQSVTKSSLRDG